MESAPPPPLPPASNVGKRKDPTILYNRRTKRRHDPMQQAGAGAVAVDQAAAPSGTAAAEPSVPVQAPAPVQGPMADSSSSDDSDFVPMAANPAPAAANPRPARRRRRGNAAAPADGDNAEEEKDREKLASFRCSAKKLSDLIAVCDDDLKGRLHVYGFGQLLRMNRVLLDRSLMVWLMSIFNPESMKLEIGGGKEISVDEHSVWCMFMLNKEGIDLPDVDEEVARAARRALRARLYNGVERGSISAAHLMKLIQNRTVTGDLAVRCFVMVILCHFLFPNSDAYIRLVDVAWTEDLDVVRRINWCKAVVEGLRAAGRQYVKDKAVKGPLARMNGCGILLLLLYVDRLRHGLDIDQVSLPRCAVLTNEKISEIVKKDLRTVGDGGIKVFCNQKQFVIRTCSKWVVNFVANRNIKCRK